MCVLHMCPKKTENEKFQQNLWGTNAHIQLKKKDIFKNFSSTATTITDAEQLFFFADFNGMHSVIHMCDWHGNVQKEQKRKTAVLSPTK